MDIHAEKNLLIKMILETEDKNLLNKIKQFFVKSNNIDFWDKLSTEQKTEINEGIEDFENGDFVDYNSFIKKYK